MIVSLSDKIAMAVPHLTLDFLSEVCSAMDKADPGIRLHCLAYMSPWLKNLALFVDPTNPCHDHSGAKLMDCIRLLIDLTLADSQVRNCVLWSRIRLWKACAGHSFDSKMHLGGNWKARHFHREFHCR